LFSFAGDIKTLQHSASDRSITLSSPVSHFFSYP
jgi:hypothetical protein